MPADTPPDRDFVVELLRREARAKTEQYKLEGAAAILDQPRPSALRTNKTFLRNVIRNTDSHNQFLGRREELASRAKLHSLVPEAPTPHDPAAGADRSRRRRRSTGGESSRGSDSESDTTARRRRRRLERERDRDRGKPRERDSEGDRRGDLIGEPRRESHRSRDILGVHSKDDGTSRRHRESTHRTGQPRDRSRSRDRDRNQDRDRDRKRDRDRDRDRDKAEHSRGDGAGERKPTKISNPLDRPRRSRSASSDDHDLDNNVESKPRTRTRTDTRAPPVRGPVKPHRSVLSAAAAAAAASAAVAPPRPGERASLLQAHDDRVARRPGRATDPATPHRARAKVGAGEETTASRARLEWQRSAEARMRQQGYSDQEIARWAAEGLGEKQGEGPIGSGAIRWTGRGETREWDAGKVFDEEGNVSLKARWG